MTMDDLDTQIARVAAAILRGRAVDERRRRRARGPPARTDRRPRDVGTDRRRGVPRRGAAARRGRRASQPSSRASTATGCGSSSRCRTPTTSRRGRSSPCSASRRSPPSLHPGRARLARRTTRRRAAPWFARDIGLFVLPVLAAYFAVARRMPWQRVADARRRRRRARARGEPRSTCSTADLGATR